MIRGATAWGYPGGLPGEGRPDGINLIVQAAFISVFNAPRCVLAVLRCRDQQVMGIACNPFVGIRTPELMVNNPSPGCSLPAMASSSLLAGADPAFVGREVMLCTLGFSRCLYAARNRQKW